MVDNVGMTGYRQGIPNIVIGDKNTDIPLSESSDNIPEIAYGDGVDSAEGFIQEQKPRICSQGPAYFCPPPLSPGQGIRPAPGQIRNSEICQKALQQNLTVRPCQIAPDLKNRLNIL